MAPSLEEESPVSTTELPSSSSSATITLNKPQKRILFGILSLVFIFFAIDSVEWKSESKVRTATAKGEQQLKDNNNKQSKEDILAQFQQKHSSSLKQQPKKTPNRNNNTDGSNSKPTTKETPPSSTSTNAAQEPKKDYSSQTTSCGSHPDSYRYQRRGRKPDESNPQQQSKEQQEQEWGAWTFEDTRESLSETFYRSFPNRDVPHAKFPSNSWQRNAKYLKPFLEESIQLIQRSLNAIVYEYTIGTTTNNNPQPLLSPATLSSPDFYKNRGRLFRLIVFDDINNKTKFDPTKENAAGWITTKCWNGLKRRLLHAIMTEDSFVFVTGGHSAAAGHGNLFQQSYTLQVQRILEPIFARLGVYHEARNLAHGGLGTLQDALGSASLYGPDVDFLVWDSGMTEKMKKETDLFARQGLLGSDSRVPIVWNLPPLVVKPLGLYTNADLGGSFFTTIPVPKAQNNTQLASMPYAIRYMKCNKEMDKDFCKTRTYQGQCWIDRTDFVPPTPQDKHPGSRVSWHPGFRVHQYKGRVLTFMILEALLEALEYWNSQKDLVLPDEDWHVTEYYESIRTKTQGVDPSSQSKCFKFEGILPQRVCNYPVQGRTEYTPRAYPALSSIRSLMPVQMAALISPSEPNVYNPPDAYNSLLHPESKAIDVLGIVEGGVNFRPIPVPSYVDHYGKQNQNNNGNDGDNNGWDETLKPGTGIRLSTKPGDCGCDGTLNSFCNRGVDNKCLLYAHNDGRGGLLMDSSSGWMLLELPHVQHGAIVVNLEILRDTEQEGEMKSRVLATSNTNVGDWNLQRRRTKDADSQILCNEFRFEHSINGVVKGYSKDEFLGLKQNLQRIVNLYTLLDDETFPSGNVKLGLRIRGCDRSSVIKLTHIYWS